MAKECKEMEGVLFPNDNRTSEKSPHFTGEARAKGELFKLAAWKNKSQSGRSYMKIKLEEPREGGFTPANQKPLERDPWDD
tara:strand:+ start:10 stop:252 length:243 start_codon:yes stop_codon:yes gene_type:complete